MKNFVLIFRESNDPDLSASPEEMQGVMNDWMNWMGGMAAQNKLVDNGNRLSKANARTVRPNNKITDGPYTEIKEFINGYIIVRTENIEEAVGLAKECPILKTGGNVEVRTAVAVDDHS
ncbi:MAG TPA: YciI family protein [Puia sp.]|nr:YciI family protein [Puia sp.]